MVRFVARTAENESLQANGGFVWLRYALAWAQPDPLPARAEAVRQDLRAWWRFDEGPGAPGRVDSSPRRAHYTDPIGPGVTWTQSAGVPGAALDFNRLGGTRLGGGPLQGVAQFTVEMWLFPESVDAAGNTLYGLDDRVPASGQGVLLGLGTDRRWVCRTSGDANGGTARAGAGDRTQLPLGFWYHVACVFDGERLKLYSDGLQYDDVPTHPLDFRPNTGALHLGERYFDRSGDWDGGIDELRISAEALEAHELNHRPPAHLALGPEGAALP